MGFIEIPEVQKFHGQEAIRVLQDYTKALEHYNGNALSTKQKKALIQISNSLIVTIKEEMQSNAGKKPVHVHFEQNPFGLFKKVLPWIPH